jgi:hypothetical protein
MQQRTSLLLLLEALWWVITAVLAITVLWPVWQAGIAWPFQTWNVIFVVALVTFVRYIFLLKHTFLAYRQVLKIVLVLALFPITFALIGGLNSFQAFVEEQTWDVLTGHLPALKKRAIESYLWNEMLFFAVGSVISGITLAIRLFVSVWRLRNRGTV